MRTRLIISALLAGLLAAVPASAQFGGDESYAKSTLYTRVDGDVVQARIVIEIQKGWHLYHAELGPEDAVGKPTTVTLTGKGVSWGEVRFPEPHKLPQPGLGEGGRDTWIWGHEGRIVLSAAGKLAKGASGSDIGATVDGLTCEDEGSCVPYMETIASSGRGPDGLFGAGTNAEAGSELAFEGQSNERSRTLWSWLLLAFIAGAILNVMPCVLPVISIKVLSFVQQAGENRRRVFTLGLSFAAGILLVFLVLGALAVLAGLSWGEQFQNETFKIVMLTVIFALSLSLFGVFELGVPAGTATLAGKVKREGHVDAFLKGVLATVLATPCSGPFLGSTIAWALAQPAYVVLSVFATMGLGMAIPYVILTANPVFLRIIPRPGPWMETFKHLMGFLLLATVVYLMWSVKGSLLLMTNILLLFIAAAAWFWGRYAQAGQSSGKRMAVGIVALLLVGGGSWVCFGKLRPIFDPPVAEAQEVTDAEWAAFFTSHLGKEHLFVDFTADWCPNCKWNERVVYHSAEVQALLERKGVRSIVMDITHQGGMTPRIEALMQKLGARSIPFMAVFPRDDPGKPTIRFDIVKKADMLEILEGLPDPAPSEKP